MKTLRTLNRAASLLGLAVAMAAPASAQSVPAGSEVDTSGAAPSGAQPADAASATEIGEIVVTARKRSESVIETPVSVVALNAQALQNRGITNLQGLQDFTPGFKFQNQSVNRNDRAFNTLVMRGLYPGSDSSDRQVATVFLDGVPLHGGLIPGLTDIERVEVVLGPQSAYFGRATFAGAVNFVTTPAGQDFKASVNADIARFDYKDIRASVEGGLAEGIAVRVSGRYYDQDGQYRNFGYGTRLGAQQTKSGALGLTFKPTERLTIRAYGTIWEDDDGSPASGQLYRPDYNCTLPGQNGPTGYICGRVREVPRNRMTQNNEVGSTLIARLNSSLGASLLGGDFSDEFGLQRKAKLGSLIANYEFDSGFAISALGGGNSNKRQFITDTIFRDARTTPNPSAALPTALLPYRQATTIGQEHIRNHSAELRLSSPSDKPFSFVVGGNYFHKSLQTAATSFTDAGALNNVTPPRAEIADTYGLFAAITYRLSDFVISAEGRVQRDKLQSNAFTQTNPPAPPLRLSDKFDSFTPRVIVQYNPNRQLNIYASYSEGTRPGEFNNAYFSRPAAVQALVTAQGINVPISVGEERLKMGELGLKGQFLDNRLRLITAVYYGRWTGKHIQQNVTYLSAPNVFTTFQVIAGGGIIRAKGVEVQAAFQATEGLLLEGTFNVADTNIRNSFCLECLVLVNRANQVGKQLPKYSRTQASASATYTVPVSDTWNALLRADAVYASRQYESEANISWITPGWRVNLRAGIRSDRYRLELFGTNVFNNKNPTAISRNTDSFTPADNTLSVSPALRAVYGVSAGVTF